MLQELMDETGGLERAEETVNASINALLSRERLRTKWRRSIATLSVADAEEMDDLIRKKQRLPYRNRHSVVLGGRVSSRIDPERSFPFGGLVHPDVAALLAVQDDDAIIDDLETRLAELRPRLDAMAAEHDRAVEARQQAHKHAESEERRRQDVAARVAQHRALQDKNQTALNSVTSMREATAATAQLEQAKRMIDEDERELASIGQRLVEANHLVDGARRNRQRAGGRAGAGAFIAHGRSGADRE